MPPSFYCKPRWIKAGGRSTGHSLAPSTQIQFMNNQSKKCLSEQHCRHGRGKQGGHHCGYHLQIMQMITNINKATLVLDQVLDLGAQPGFSGAEEVQRRRSGCGNSGMNRRKGRTMLEEEESHSPAGEWYHTRSRTSETASSCRRRDKMAQPLSMTMATRRFSARPAAVPLSAMGAASPRPRMSRFAGGMPTDIRTSATERARLSESCSL